MYNDIIAGDTVGRANFPFQFCKVIQKKENLLVVELQSKPGRRVAIKRKDFEKGIFQKFDIEDAEIIVEETKKLE